MQKFKNRKILFLLVLICLLVLTASPVWAIKIKCESGDEVECPETTGIFAGLSLNPCRCCGDCELNDFLRLGINIGKIILSWSGVALLVVFIVGGIMWMTSGGAAEKISQGKKWITNGVVGLIIILFAYTFISWLGGVLQVGEKKKLEFEVEVKKEPQKVEEKKGPAEEKLKTCVAPTKDPASWWTAKNPCQDEEIGLVAMYQRYLNKWGYNCGEENGVYGASTEACTQVFQRDYSLKDIDGIVGSETWGAFKKVVDCVSEGEDYFCRKKDEECADNAKAISSLPCPGKKTCCRLKCEKRGSTYRCRDRDLCNPETIILNLCPGGVNNVCCKL